MKNLLKTDWNQKYIDYITNQSFTDKVLQKDFLNIIKQTNSKARENSWSNLRINIVNVKEVWKLSNPYYLGFGNPNAEVLFLGKEKGFDIIEHPDLFIKESINNIIHWNEIEKLSRKDHENINHNLGFNPMFPRIHHRQNLLKSHTWGLYSKIIAKVYILDHDAIFKELDNISNSFFNHCFLSEINHVPSKYSKGLKMTKERSILLHNDFYKKFPKVIIGAKGYLTLEDIKDMFNIEAANNGNKILIGSNKARNIYIHKFVTKSQVVILCDQLSGAAGWTNNAIDRLVSHL